jgi:tetratricopeptide (TPR) repeat protein
MNIDELTGHYTPDFLARLLGLAVDGGDVDTRMDKVLRRLARTGPEGKQLRDEVRAARKAAEVGNSNESVGRVVQLAELMRASGFPEFTALLCALAVNMRNQLGNDLDPEDAADLANITGALASDFHDFDTAKVQYDRALEIARQTGNRTAEASFLLNLTNLARSLGDDTQAERLALQALAIAEELEDEYRQLQLLFTLGYMATDNGDLDAARQWLDRAEPLTKRVRYSGLTSGYHHLNGLIATKHGDYQAAEAAWKRSLAAARRAGDHDKEVASLQNLAAVAGDAGNHALALRRTGTAAEAAAEYRLLSRLTALLPALVRAETNYGSKARALDAARHLVEISVATNTGVGEAHALLGATLVDNDHLEEGVTELESAWQLLDGDQSSEAAAARPHLVHNLIVGHANARTLAQVWPELAERAEKLERTLATEVLQVLGLQMLTQPDIDQSHVAEVLLRSVKRRPPAERAWTAATLAAQATAEGADHAAVQLLNLSLATATRRKQETTLRHIRNDLALALTRTHNYTRARNLLNTNLVKADADDDLRTQWLALFNLAELCRRTDKREVAEQYARRALAVALDANDTESIHDSQLQLGMTLSDLGRYDEATSELTTVLRNADSNTSEYAGAAHSLANIALANDDLENALRHYRTAVDHEARESIQALESLLGYAEALAAAGQRRTFNRVFQRAIDAFDKVPYTGDLAIRITHIARRWARANKPKFAGEALAAALVIPATVGQQRFKEAPTDADYPVLDEALLAVAAELHYQAEVEPMGDQQQLLDAIQADLRRLANASVAKAAIKAVRLLLTAIESDPD